MLLGMRTLFATILVIDGRRQFELSGHDLALGASNLGWMATTQSGGRHSGESNSMNSSGHRVVVLAGARKTRA